MMNRRCISMILFLVIISVVVIQAEAQLVDYNRRGKESTVSIFKSGSTSTPKSAASTPAIEQKISSLPKATNRVERLYDRNQDGELQKAEVDNFFEDVISAVERRGDFSVSSQLLQEFDLDNDGKISKYEVRAIKSKLE